MTEKETSVDLDLALSHLPMLHRKSVGEPENEVRSLALVHFPAFCIIFLILSTHCNRKPEPEAKQEQHY